MRKTHIDARGAALLLLFTMILGINQIVMKVNTEGLSPAFQVGLRSAGASVLIFLYIRWKRIPFPLGPRMVGAGILLGCVFSAEFLALYLAIDLTTVSRVSIVFYSMPVYLSLGAHFLFPGERLTPTRILGLLLAMAGIVVVMADRTGGEASLAGDLLALCAALGWAAIPFVLRLTALRDAPNEAQLLWQIGISAPILLALAPLFGPLVRDFRPLDVALMAYQIVAVASFAFLLWFVLLRTYPASGVASFSFVTPVLAVFLAHLILGEELHASVLLALALVAAGIVLINRRVGGPPHVPPQVPQKVA